MQIWVEKRVGRPYLRGTMRSWQIQYIWYVVVLSRALKRVGAAEQWVQKDSLTITPPKTGNDCTNCAEGRYSDKGASKCEPCPPGRYAEKIGSANCTLCKVGKYQSASEKTTCDFCYNGNVTDRSKQLLYQNHSGQSSCKV